MSDNNEYGRWHTFNKSFFRGMLLLLDCIFLFILYIQEKVPNGIYFSGLMEHERFYEIYFNSLALTEINETIGMIMVGLMPFLIISCVSDFVKKSTLRIFNFCLLLNSAILGGYVVCSVLVTKCCAYIYVLYILVAVACLIIFVGNIFYYNRHKDLMKKEKRVAVSWIVLGVAMLFMVLWSGYCGGNLPEELNAIKKDRYKDYLRQYVFDVDDFYFDDFDDENDNLRYALVEYVNYFGESGEAYTVEELEVSVSALYEAFRNSYDEPGLWYKYYQFVEDNEDLYKQYDFTGYNYWIHTANEYATDNMCYASCVARILQDEGMELEEANVQQLDNACQEAYEILSKGEIQVIDEVTLEINNPIVGEEMDFSVCYDSEAYDVIFSSWQEGDTFSDTSAIYYGEVGTSFEKGKQYQASLRVFADVGYTFDDDIKINVMGIDYDDVETYIYNSNNIIVIDVFKKFD
ncbi:MAG: hypothetical protein E7259_09585 [Lachnospiraceae bacterium]|nr:hypothetical protein [Lachnospiraceae bacterium]